MVAREHRAARRRQGVGALLDRLRHQARHGMRDLPVRRGGRRGRNRHPRRVQGLRGPAARALPDHPAQCRRVAGLVRAHEPLVGHEPGAIRHGRHVPCQVHHLRQPARPRPRLRRPRRRRLLRPPLFRNRRRLPQHPAHPDVHPLQAARHGGREPRRHVRHGPVFRRSRRQPHRLAFRPLHLPRARRPRSGVHRDDLPLGRCPHHARLHRAVDRRARSPVEAHRRLRPCQHESQAGAAARPCRPQRLDATRLAEDG